jgi:hypothetical protein
MSARPSPGNNVRVIEEHFGITKALPDELVQVTLSDGRTFVIPGHRLVPQDDGTYSIKLDHEDRQLLQS